MPTTTTQTQSDHDILIRLDENVRNLHLSVSKLTDDHEKRLADHETRMRTLEKEANRWLGKQSIIGGAIGAAVSIAGSFIQAGKF